jgi:hypothetical protein
MNRSLTILVCALSALVTVACQRTFEDSGIPAALGMDGALEAGGANGPMSSPATNPGRLTRGVRHVELTKEFAVELKDGRTWTDLLIGSLSESRRVVTSKGGTVGRPWTSSAECGVSYTYGEKQGRIKISAFKQSNHVRIRFSCYEEKP